MAGVAPGPDRTLLIACGALARETLAVIRANGIADRVAVTCLPAILHNRPERIADRLRQRIRTARAMGWSRIRIAYADCGSGGAIDRVAAEEGAERIGGPHCYAFFAGAADFDRLMEEEPGSFFLTDYLVRHFQALIVEGMGLDRHPELLSMIFGNYRRLVYLAQTEDPALQGQAKAAAERLGLGYEYRHTGYGEFAQFVAASA